VLDPRIYRAALLPLLPILAVAAFALHDQPKGASTALATDAFNGARAWSGATGLTALQRAFPDRSPGSPGDQALADRVRDILGAPACGGVPCYAVSVSTTHAQTLQGARRLETIVAVRAGLSAQRIVILSHRDAVAPGSPAELSGTAALLELAHVLGGRALNRTLVLVSTSGGSGGGGGATAWAQTAPGPTDAVIVLGDLGSDRSGPGPLLVPWGAGRGQAPVVVTDTVGAALRAETGLVPGATSVARQFARLAVALTPGEQGGPVARGLPAVLLSLDGERAIPANAHVSQARLQSMGRTVLRAVLAFDSARALPADRVERSIFTARQRVPEWAVTLLVGGALFPVLLCAGDAAARARRRRQPLGRWIGWTAAAAMPFLIVAALARLLVALGLLTAAPSAPVTSSLLVRGGRGDALLVAEALALVLGLIAWHTLVPRLIGTQRRPDGIGPPAAVVLVAVLATCVVWVVNPYAAALVVPLLHLALLALAPDLRLPRGPALGLLTLGLLPLIAVTWVYAGVLGVGPVGLAWTALVLLASGSLGALATVTWALLLGCLAGAAATVLGRRDVVDDAPAVSVRGPVGYAGPGSLGGTESALRR